MEDDAKGQPPQLTLRLTPATQAEFKAARDELGMSSDAFLVALLRRGGAWVAAWRDAARGTFADRPDVDVELRALLTAEMQLRIRLNQLALRIAGLRSDATEEELRRAVLEMEAAVRERRNQTAAPDAEETASA